MGEVTEERLQDLVTGLKKSVPEVNKHDPAAADLIASGAQDIEYHLVGGHIDVARRSVKDLWADLLEFGVIRGLVGARAPGQDPPPRDRGLEQTADTVEIFNDIVMEIGTLPR